MDCRHTKSFCAIMLRPAQAIILLCSILSLHCFNEPLEPVIPSWDVNLSIPLANREYTLLEIVEKDTSILTVGGGDQIIYSTSVVASPTFVGDLITLSPNDTTVDVDLGAFQLNATSTTIPIGLPWLPRGATAPIPDTTINVGNISDTLPTFQSVSFESGTISLTIDNNLPVPLEVVNPLELLDDQNDVVVTFVFNPSTVPPNSSRTAADNLADKTLTSVLNLSGLTLHIIGSQTPVPIPTGDLVVATLATNEVKASQAVFAEIPPQIITNNDTANVNLDDSTIVKEVRFRSGILDFRFTNTVSLDILFKYRLSELQQWTGGMYVPYEDSISLPALSTDSIAIDLAGWKIQTQTGGLVRSLELVSTIGFPTGSTQPVTVRATDQVLISVRSNDAIIVDSAVAVLRPTWLDVNTSVRVDFGEWPTRFVGQLNIPGATLNLNTMSAIGFPADLYVKVGAMNAAGDSVFLTVPTSQKRFQPGSGTLQFDTVEVGSFLSAFSERLPDSLHILGRVLVNPPDLYNPTLAGVGSIGRNSSFGASLDMEVPLFLGIIDGSYADTVAVGDTTGDGYKDYDINKDRIEDVNFGKIFVEVENAMPLQLGIRMRLLDGSKETVLLVPQSGTRVRVDAAPVDAEGNVTRSEQSTSVIELNQAEVQQFNPAEFLRLSVLLITTPGDPAVRFKTTDYMRMRIWSTLSYRVNQ